MFILWTSQKEKRQRDRKSYKEIMEENFPNWERDRNHPGIWSSKVLKQIQLGEIFTETHYKETLKTQTQRWDAWVFQSVTYLSIDFGSVHDLRVVRLSPTSDSMLSKEFPWDSLSQGAWVAQLVKYMIHDFGSGYDLMGPAIKPHLGLHTQWGVCLRFSPFADLCVSTLSLFKINK